MKFDPDLCYYILKLSVSYSLVFGNLFIECISFVCFYIMCWVCI